MGTNRRLAVWEGKLDTVLRRIDNLLEDRFGAEWRLHPSRPRRGLTANPQYDGLFRVTASFTAGYGSEVGRGYLFRVEIVTLDSVADETRRDIEKTAAAYLRQFLPEAFPGRDLKVTRDRGVMKIYGDLSLKDG